MSEYAINEQDPFLLQDIEIVLNYWFVHSFKSKTEAGMYAVNMTIVEGDRTTAESTKDTYEYVENWPDRILGKKTHITDPLDKAADKVAAMIQDKHTWENLLLKVQDECMPCFYRWIRYHKGGNASSEVLVPFLDSARLFNNWIVEDCIKRLAFLRQFAQIASMPPIMLNDICGFINSLSWGVCIPDIAAMIAMLFSLIRKYMKNMRLAFVSVLYGLMAMILQPISLSILGIVDIFHDFIFGPIYCMLDQLQALAKKADFTKELDKQLALTKQAWRRDEKAAFVDLGGIGPKTAEERAKDDQAVREAAAKQPWSAEKLSKVKEDIKAADLKRRKETKEGLAKGLNFLNDGLKNGLGMFAKDLKYLYDYISFMGDRGDKARLELMNFGEAIAVLQQQISMLTAMIDIVMAIKNNQNPCNQESWTSKTLREKNWPNMVNEVAGKAENAVDYREDFESGVQKKVDQTGGVVDSSGKIDSRNYIKGRKK